MALSVNHKRIFFEELTRRISDLHDWYHEDSEGTLWMVVSYDFVGDVRV